MLQVIDRILYKLDELVRPFVHKILVVIEPLLIDEDYYARVEGREIIANLSKAAGLATMIAAMRPDIDNIDEYVRNTTARAFRCVKLKPCVHYCTVSYMQRFCDGVLGCIFSVCTHLASGLQHTLGQYAIPSLHRTMGCSRNNCGTHGADWRNAVWWRQRWASLRCCLS